MRVAIYTRVSTTDQNAEMQRRELLAYCGRAGWNQVQEFSDVASGATKKRPELERMMEDIRQRRISTVIVWSLDRLGRSLPDCLSLIEEMKRKGTRLLCLSQPIDTDKHNPAGELVLQVLAAAAQFERAMILERSAAGRARYEADLAAGRVGKSVHSQSGKDLPPHRPKKIFDRQRVHELRAQGLSIKQIADVMKLGRGTVHRTLKSYQPSPGSVPKVRRKTGHSERLNLRTFEPDRNHTGKE